MEKKTSNSSPPKDKTIIANYLSGWQEKQGRPARNKKLSSSEKNKQPEISKQYFHNKISISRPIIHNKRKSQLADVLSSKKRVLNEMQKYMPTLHDSNFPTNLNTPNIHIPQTTSLSHSPIPVVGTSHVQEALPSILFQPPQMKVLKEEKVYWDAFHACPWPLAIVGKFY